MSNINELIGQLRRKGLSRASTLGYHSGLFDEAADALEKLQVESEQAKAERDAAIKDLNEFLSMDELCPIQCEWCKWNDTCCDGKTPEWRGIKGD